MDAVDQVLKQFREIERQRAQAMVDARREYDARCAEIEREYQAAVNAIKRN